MRLKKMPMFNRYVAIIVTLIAVSVGAQAVFGKYFENFLFQGNTIQATNTNGGITLRPNGSGQVEVYTQGQVMTVSSTDNVSNKSFADNSMFVVDNGDPTKRVQFQLSDVTAGQISLLTIPDLDGEIVLTTGAQALVDKVSENLNNQGYLTIGGSGTTGQREARFMDDDTNYVALKAPQAMSGNYTLTMPGTDGTSGQVMSTNGSGTLSWTTVNTGSYAGSNDDRENLGLSVSVAGNAMTIALKQTDGTSDPASGSGAVKIGFRSTTTSNGGYSVVSATAATSLVISSGSTLGSVNSAPVDIYVYALNFAGAIELAATSTYYPDNQDDYTTVTEGGAGAADSRVNIYSTTGRGNVSVRLIGRIRTTQTTAGTWASAPSRVEIAPFDLGCNPDRGTGFGCNATYAAVLNCDSSSTVTSQHDTWVSSVANISGGQCTVTLTAGAFSAAPICAVNRVGANATSIEFIQISNATSTSFIMTCALISNGSSTIAADTVCDASVVCVGPK